MTTMALKLLEKRTELGKYMTEILTKLELTLNHYKDGELVAVTHFNNPTKLLKTKEMDRKDYEEFYEADTTQK